MKKAMLCMSLICAFTISLFGDYAVDSTRSMDTTHVNAIRTAFSGSSEIGEFYWEDFVANDPTQHEMEDSLMGEYDRGWQDYFNADLYVKYAMWGAVGLDMPVTTPPTTDTMLLDKAKYYLLDPSSPESYLDLDDVWEELSAGNDVGGNPWMGFITRNTALMVDMLWNYVDSTERVEMCSKLDSLADTLYYHLNRLKETWGLGEKPQFFGMAPDAAALGYAGCVLGDTTYINFSKDQILNYQVPYTEETQNGYLDLFTARENYISEGLTYFGSNFLTQTSIFFTAYLRMYDENLYNEDLINNIMNKFINMIRPDMLFLTLDDCFLGHWGNNTIDEYYFLLSIFEYYYNNTTGDNDNLIRWYFNEFKNNYCDYGEYPSLVCWFRNFHPIFSYNPNKTVEIDSSYTLPDVISQESFSDEELTIMRQTTSTQQQYEKANALYVNYDNSLDPSWHEHGDQTSYQLFADGEYFIIDPGYIEGQHDFRVSPYAHSLIIINPDESKLCGSEPIYRNLISPGNPSIVYTPNPSFKDHFINNTSIEKLKIYMDYVEDPNGDDTVRVERNFYSFDNMHYVIYDNLLRLYGSNSDSIWNTIHFASHTGSNDYLTWYNNGEFVYEKYQEVTLFGTIGSSDDFTISATEDLSTGLLNDGQWANYHTRLEIQTNSIETSFMTILFPTESSSNPISVADSSGYYAVEIYDAAKTPVEKSYYAVSDSILDISFDDIDINSDAAFVGMTYRPGYQFATKVTQFIMADGDILFYNDNDTLLVDSDSSIDEVIASYTGTELSVIVKSDDEYPQYRILRQGVDPDNFTSICVANKENGTSNIEHLSYDSNYFYVNWYDFSSGTVNLITPILVPEGETLVIGNGVTINCMNANVAIEVYGDIEIGNNVTFTSPDSVQWDGLYLLNTSATITMNNVTFERGKLHNDSRSLMISNSEFNNSGIEQSGSKINVSETNFNSSNIFCERLNSCESVDMGEVYITGCEFINFSDYYAVSISTYPIYNLSDNEISNCFAGLRIVESGHPKMCVIKNNIIRWSTNGVGICIYHSYADISGHNRIIGNLIGILGAKDSSIKIMGDIDYPYQSINDNIYEEIVTDCYSFPHKKGIRYNEIVDDEYIEGTRDQYLFVCKGATGAQRELNVEYNYWGQESLEWNEGDGDDRFYPAELFDYIPVWDPGFPESPEISVPELLYADADSFIQIEEYEEAKIVYRNIIQLYPECKFSIFSMRNLLPLETVSGQDFSSLKEYYLTEPNCNIDDERTKLSQYLANYCTIKMEQYPEAISFFEAIISDPDTELDSVYAVIDAGYTYLLMENGGKSGYIGKMAELKPKSEIEFRIMRDDLLSELFEIIQIEPEEPNVEYAFDLKHNYPNPFNSKTTISFSLPLSTQKAELKIYNIKGQLVRKLDMDTKLGIGSITWDSLDNSGKLACNGVYFYKLIADKKEIVKKMLMMR